MGGEYENGVRLKQAFEEIFGYGGVTELEGPNLKARYLAAQRKWHPDREGGNSLISQALNTAYDHLKLDKNISTLSSQEQQIILDAAQELRRLVEEEKARKSEAEKRGYEVANCKQSLEVVRVRLGRIEERIQRISEEINTAVAEFDAKHFEAQREIDNIYRNLNFIESDRKKEIADKDYLKHGDERVGDRIKKLEKELNEKREASQKANEELVTYQTQQVEVKSLASGVVRFVRAVRDGVADPTENQFKQQVALAQKAVDETREKLKTEQREQNQRSFETEKQRINDKYDKKKEELEQELLKAQAKLGEEQEARNKARVVFIQNMQSVKAEKKEKLNTELESARQLVSYWEQKLGELTEEKKAA